MPAGKKECQPSILRSFEKRVLKRIFRKLLQSGEFAIVLEREELASRSKYQADKPGLPNLYRTLQILIKPDRMLGQSGQGADLLETRFWDALSDRVASYSASRSFRTAAI